MFFISLLAFSLVAQAMHANQDHLAPRTMTLLQTDDPCYTSLLSLAEEGPSTPSVYASWLSGIATVTDPCTTFTVPPPVVSAYSTYSSSLSQASHYPGPNLFTCAVS